MSDHVRILLNWLRYADYLMAWAEIPMSDRPRFRVKRVGDDWRPAEVTK